MDVLSFELISLIVENLEDDLSVRLAPFATISRQWQAVVERRTFTSLNVTDLSEFQTHVTSSPSHLMALREVYLELTLPTDGESRVGHRQRRIESRFPLRSEVGAVFNHITAMAGGR